MSTRAGAWMVGAVVGGTAIAYVNYGIIKPNQSNMLLNLRQALLTPEVRQKHADMHAASLNAVNFPFFSRETLNLVLISLSDRFIHTQDRKTTE